MNCPNGCGEMNYLGRAHDSEGYQVEVYQCPHCGHIEHVRTGS